MSNKQDSNIIHIDFNTRKAVKKQIEAQPFSQLIERVITSNNEGPDEWPEDLTPRERNHQLKQDLEFLRQMNEVPSTKY